MSNLKALYIAKSVRGRKQRRVDLVDARDKRERERKKEWSRIFYEKAPFEGGCATLISLL